jgi:hypothetical protein
VCDCRILAAPEPGAGGARRRFLMMARRCDAPTDG